MQHHTLLIPQELQEFFVERILVRLQHADPVLTLTNLFFWYAVFRAPFEKPLKVIDGTRIIPGQGASYASAITNVAVIRFQRDRSLTSRHHSSRKAPEASKPAERIPRSRSYL